MISIVNPHLSKLKSPQFERVRPHPSPCASLPQAQAFREPIRGCATGVAVRVTGGDHDQPIDVIVPPAACGVPYRGKAARPGVVFYPETAPALLVYASKATISELMINFRRLM